jgi:hypothetical protein
MQVIKKVGSSRCIASVLHEKCICSSGCKERKRAHPKMVLVHDPSQESLLIDLLEVGGGCSTLVMAPFLSWLDCVSEFSPR